MTNFELLTVADVGLMQGLAQRVTALRPELVNAETTYGELPWEWGKGVAARGHTWPRRLWFAGDQLVAWGWAHLPHQIRRSDGTVKDVTDTRVVYQVHPDHAPLVDEVIGWYEQVADGLPRAAVPTAADEFALARWAAHGYVTDPDSLGDNGHWTQLNQRDLADIEQPEPASGFRFRTAADAGPEAAVRAHMDAWAPSAYTAQAYDDVRQTAAYRGDLHVLVEAPDGTMRASTIMWLDEANRTVEFEPVGTHPDYRGRGLARAMLLHGLHLARDAGATRATVACIGSPGRAAARNLYYSLGFRELSRDAPLVKAV